jgi:DNA repair exonuclease SbcCD ATPase subunit
MLSRNQQQKLLKDLSPDGEEPAAACGNAEQTDTPEARTDVLASRISELRSCLEDLGDMVSPDTSAPLDEASESRADDLRSRISDLRCDLEDLDDVLRLDDSDSFLETMEVRISELGSRITELRSDLGDICDMSASNAESSEIRFKFLENDIKLQNECLNNKIDLLCDRVGKTLNAGMPPVGAYLRQNEINSRRSLRRR